MADVLPAALGLRPGGPIRGAIAVPGSKSIAQRAIVLAALCSGRTRLAGLPDGGDVKSALALVAAAGARVESLAPAACAIEGRPPGPHRGWRADPGLDAGESGTLARLATAAFAFCGQVGSAGEVRVSGTLARRSSPPLFAALRAAGVRTDPDEAVSWPVRLKPIGPPSDVQLVDPVSSQEVTALLVALASWPDAYELTVLGAIPSRPYLALTLGVLEVFGVRVAGAQLEAGTGRQPDLVERFALCGPLRAPEDPILVEPDASAAAVALAAGCLSGGEVMVRGLSRSSLQGDVRIVDHLEAFGCITEERDEGLLARGVPDRGADVDLSGEPDLAPVLAAVAARAALDTGAMSRLGGLGTLPGKESSRIEVLAEGLRAIGLAAEGTADALVIGPGTRRAPAGPLDPRGDHRMAFAFALLGLSCESVLVGDPQCVGKSWPGFWRAMARAGASIERVAP